MSGKIKIKIVLLGNQSVGKTCIIEKYVKDRFDETANVHSS
jgi:GTPase SAR1 family protein